ncbi:MFS transporter [Pseudomonas sp. CR3202]|uniref:MFS transporter n=1 Tax=Pseudomonas sp. CR3202 TaxID=3351532 RepID=UPI003BF34D8D
MEFSASAAPAQQLPAWRVWLSIVLLGVGAFTIVTTELAPIGLLSPIALEFGRSDAVVGLTVTLYAWIGACSALLAALALNGLPRKPLLIGLMLGLTLSNAIALLALNFGMFLLARVLGALVHGLFWAVIAATAAQIAPARHVGLATSIVFGGVSVASVLGVPLANFIAQVGNWRMSFGGICGLSLIAVLLMLPILPSIQRQPEKAGYAALAGVLRRADLRGIYAATALAVTGHFAAFTFIEPFLRSAPGVSVPLVAALLFGFGAAGLFANLLTGIFIDRYLKPFLMLALGLLSLALLVMGQWGDRLGILGISFTLVIWGCSTSAIFVGFQTWILRTSGTAVMPASAVYVAIFNAAIGIGAMIGAWILSHSGLPAVLKVAGMSGGLAILLVAWLDRPTPVFQEEIAQ